MAVPEQIRRQSEQIQKLYTDMNDSEEGNVADSEEEVVASGEVNEDADGGNDDASSIAPGEQPDADAEESFQHKYNTLKGMYNADMARLGNSSREQQARIEQLEQLLTTLSEKQPEPTTEAPTTSEPVTLVTAADKEEYGDSLDVMRKVSREEVSGMEAQIASLKELVQQLSTNVNSSVLPEVKRVAQNQHASASDKFWSDLANAVPNWQQTNNEPEFQSWLMQIDPMTGVPRQTHLAQAQEQLDAHRVAAFFNAYAPQEPSETTEATTAQPNGASSELEKQISPGRSRSARTLSTQELPTFTTADIAKFYRDITDGVYRNKPDERAKLERDIFAAQQDGRITQSA
ncbi:hypothetical protein [uncultured Paraglaciecola sp.]|uniref:hypothetical protein n=1 Tax=uncultured Paraglaciecola sp. TaxID=1765024 RepID=UPI00262A92FF|nr:hypothetical protein [uncultured Paraglaciecola sp.]